MVVHKMNAQIFKDVEGCTYMEGMDAPSEY